MLLYTLTFWTLGVITGVLLHIIVSAVLEIRRARRERRVIVSTICDCAGCTGAREMMS